MSSHTINPVFRSLNRPMLLLGVERKLFFFLLTASFALFNLTGGLLPAFVLFVVLWMGARLAQQADPQVLRIALNSRRWHTRYDPAKWSPTDQKGGASRGSPQRSV